jgi:putative membrane-bound dehydrogenase-like protein
MNHRSLVPGLAFAVALLSQSSLAAQDAAAPDAPVPAHLAAGKMTLPEGFKATLFAGEPDVVQPIAFCFDDRGRLWVAECLSYPNWEADPKKGKDRILIFEDTDGDGKFDKRTVFADHIQNISGIQYGFGGVWVCSTPNLIFIPDKNGDDVPDGPPEIVLDGWSLKAGHNVFNSLTWGPDGWLYGCNGILATSYVGRPGTPQKDRVPINCGVWRYHPTKKRFEAVAHGTTNPWGLDFDEYGEMFITNCVIDHLWHVVPGGHYQRMYGEDLNPHVYKLMPSICDHIHWGGGHWTDSRAPSNTGRAASVSERSAYQAHSEAGGGHAHTGCMIYLGDNWPARYRGGVFMCNIHGNRINHDILERNGSTYVARHGKDFMLANDPWFRGLALQYGPDGGVYVSDWCDTGECHNYKVADKTNGRIYKIVYDEVKPWKRDLSKLSDIALARLQSNGTEWAVRHSRRILQERATRNAIDPKAIALLEQALTSYAEPRHRLRALWALHGIKTIEPGLLETLFNDPDRLEDEHVRAWAIRIWAGDQRFSELGHVILRRVAASDPSPLVRLYLASLAQRANDDYRHHVGAALVSHSEDSNDPYLPLMYWHAIESVACAKERSSNQYVLSATHIALTREYIARRWSEQAEAAGDWHNPNAIVWSRLARANPSERRDILRGLQSGLFGRKLVPMPKSWGDLYADLIQSPLPEVRERALALAVQFGDARALAHLRNTVPDRAKPHSERETALKTLLNQQKPDLVPLLHGLLADESMRRPAIRGLAAYEDEITPRLLITDYPKWNADEKSDVIQTLSSRSSYALALLDAIDKHIIPRADINSYTIRQLQALKSPEVAAKLAKVWGEIRPASAEKAKLMAKYKGELRPDVLKQANLVNGRALFQKTCATCHRLFGEGSDIGPDLTGSQRTNLDYVLENVLDPSAIVPREYQVTVVVTTSGRTLSGIIKKETDAAVTVQTQNEQVLVPKSEIDSRTPTKVSMMPEGLFEQLRPEEVRDLVAYLAAPGQVAAKK